MKLWDWLNEITIKKSPVSQFSEEDWESWNSYMVHRFISMGKNNIEIANIAQRMHPTDKIGIYNFYCNMIPKKKVWNKYIKSSKKPKNKELVILISKYYNIPMILISSMPIVDKFSKDTIIIVNSCGDAKKDRDILKERLGKN